MARALMSYVPKPDSKKKTVAPVFLVVVVKDAEHMAHLVPRSKAISSINSPQTGTAEREEPIPKIT